MLTPSKRQYRQHVENYVIEHFQHLMTDLEKLAVNGAGSLSEMASAQTLLRNGVADFRSDVTESLELAHHAEIYARACPECKRLPAPPRAKHCVWCSGDWYESRLDLSAAAQKISFDAETGEAPPYLYLTEEEKERIRKTDNARYTDWILEIDGEPFGLLTDCHFVDMFWYSYQFTVISESPELKAKFNTHSFCYDPKKSGWRNQEYGISATSAWASREVWLTSGERINMRAMNITPDQWPSPEPEPKPKNVREKAIHSLKKLFLG